METTSIIDSFGGFCHEEILPALKEVAASGRWEGITPSSFNEDKGDDYYAIFLNYAAKDIFTLQLGLWGHMEENNTFAINCKCMFVDENAEKYDRAVIEEEKKVFLTNCFTVFDIMGFGVEVREEGFCAWASLDEEDGEYVVPNVEDPFSMYCVFLGVIVEVVKRMEV